MLAAFKPALHRVALTLTPAGEAAALCWVMGLFSKLPHLLSPKWPLWRSYSFMLCLLLELHKIGKHLTG